MFKKILGKKKACVFQTVGTSLPTPCPCIIIIIIIIIDINPKGAVAFLTLSAAEYKL